MIIWLFIPKGVLMIKGLIATAALLAAFSGTANAQMVSAQNPASVLKALQGTGYGAELTKDSKGDPIIKSASSGIDFSILFYGCTKNASCSTIQFFAGFKKPKNGSLRAMNEWNRKNRFSRAYIADTGSAWIEFDLDLYSDGMSTKLFGDNLGFWVLGLAKYKAFVTNIPKSKPVSKR